MAASEFDLRPMSVGDILDRTVGFYRRHFLYVVRTVAVVAPVLGPLSIWRPSLTDLMANWPAQRGVQEIAWWMLLYVAEGWFFSLGQGAIAYSIAMSFVGEAPTVRACYRRALRRSGAMVWIAGLTSLVWAAGIELPIEMGLLLAVEGLEAWDLGTGSLLGLSMGLLIPGAIVSFFVALAVPAIVIENIGALAALRRSLRLMRRNGWRAVLVFLFGFALSLIAILVLWLPVVVLGIWIPKAESKIVQDVMAQLAILLAVPPMAIAYTLLYFDSRIRHEALDLSVMADSLGAGPKAAGALAGQEMP